ncbi:Flp family type IVb pilin [Candidatus Formimonas warabiya]|uniref:Flp family type IVb pilin n=1 Tax=Formimonas warabiya TaxID=1761012 RepID=UPI001BE3DF18|nr:Flp family type IVb pilin [Candidatus Formimonas warabiya]
MNMMKQLWKQEEGQGMTEYGLIIALVAVLLIGSLVIFKDKIAAVFEGISFDDPDATTP